MAKKITDWDLYVKYASEYGEDKIYWNGAYQNFNGLDVKNTKNMIFVDQTNASSTNSQSISELNEEIDNEKKDEEENIQILDSENSNRLENVQNQVAPEQINQDESEYEYVSAEI